MQLSLKVDVNYCKKHKCCIFHEWLRCKSIWKLQKILQICVRSFVNFYPDTFQNNGFCSIKRGKELCFDPSFKFKWNGIPGLFKPCSQKCLENQITLEKHSKRTHTYRIHTHTHTHTHIHTLKHTRKWPAYLTGIKKTLNISFFT